MKKMLLMTLFISSVLHNAFAENNSYVNNASIIDSLGTACGTKDIRLTDKGEGKIEFSKGNFSLGMVLTNEGIDRLGKELKEEENIYNLESKKIDCITVNFKEHLRSVEKQIDEQKEKGKQISSKGAIFIYGDIVAGDKIGGNKNIHNDNRHYDSHDDKSTNIDHSIKNINSGSGKQQNNIGTVHNPTMN